MTMITKRMPLVEHGAVDRARSRRSSGHPRARGTRLRTPEVAHRAVCAHHRAGHLYYSKQAEVDNPCIIKNHTPYIEHVSSKRQ